MAGFENLCEMGKIQKKLEEIKYNMYFWDRKGKW